MRQSRYLVPAVTLITLALVFIDLRVARRELPFGINEGGYQIEHVLTSRHWVSSAPIFLAENFKEVRVTNVGDQTKGGFGFSDQILQIWKAGTTDASEDPIDLRGKPKLDKLISLSKENTKAYCAQFQRLFCRLDIVWDSSANLDYSVFVGVQTSDTDYGLIEAGLLKRFLAGEL